MQVLKFEDRQAWLTARMGKVTGSKLKDIIVKRGTTPKIGFYKLIAERIATSPEEENEMERGQRLEPEALERFAAETGKKIDTSLILWVSDENESIAVSPDGVIGKTEAVEAKCLSSARHIQAWHTQQIPDEYEYQVLQYFIVNEKLKVLHVVFYDPRIPAKDYFVLTVKRADVQAQVDEYFDYQREMIVRVNEIVNSLTF